MTQTTIVLLGFVVIATVGNIPATTCPTAALIILKEIDSMEEKEVVTQGEAFERLFANEDFKVLQEFIQGEIQTTSSLILTPGRTNPAIKNFEDYKEQNGILLGLAIPQSYMEDIVKQMKVFREEKRKAEEAKRARDKRQS